MTIRSDAAPLVREAGPSPGARVRTKPPLRWILGIGACVAMLALDRLLAHLAVHIDAAGALLSPVGASFEAFAVAAAFLAVRLALSLSICVAAAAAAVALVRFVWRPRIAWSDATAAQEREARGSRARGGRARGGRAQGRR